MQQEKVVVGEGTEFPLDSLLTLPDVAESGIPSVVLVHGSGPQDKDETIKAVAPFRDIAEALADKGIATLRYDKRTQTYGKEMMVHPGNITVESETIEDAIRAAHLLRDDPRIGKVFILGHSLGGMLAPRIDAEGGDFDGIIIAAGSPRTLREIMLDQFAETSTQYKGLIRKIADKQVTKLAKEFAAIDSMTDEEAQQKRLFGQTRAYYFKEMEAHPASQYLESMTKPVFIFQGDKDFQVYPEKDFEGYRQLLEGRPNVALKLYPGLNHVFNDSCKTRTIKDYETPGKVDPRVTDDIARWILSN
ncbi:MAG: lysophospholipase [Coriobacteriia bacterium]|nr:lysophospholipase [Coriobacteriia bacterium]